VIAYKASFILLQRLHASQERFSMHNGRHDFDVREPYLRYALRSNKGGNIYNFRIIAIGARDLGLEHEIALSFAGFVDALLTERRTRK
jgi:hypothetical protein